MVPCNERSLHHKGSGGCHEQVPGTGGYAIIVDDDDSASIGSKLASAMAVATCPPELRTTKRPSSARSLANETSWPGAIQPSKHKIFLSELSEIGRATPPQLSPRRVHWTAQSTSDPSHPVPRHKLTSNSAQRLPRLAMRRVRPTDNSTIKLPERHERPKGSKDVRSHLSSLCIIGGLGCVDLPIMAGH